MKEKKKKGKKGRTKERTVCPENKTKGKLVEQST